VQSTFRTHIWAAEGHLSEVGRHEWDLEAPSGYRGKSPGSWRHVCENMLLWVGFKMHAWLYASVQYEMEEKSIWGQKSGTASNSASKYCCLPYNWTTLSIAYWAQKVGGWLPCPIGQSPTHFCAQYRQALCSPREKSIFHLTSHIRVDGPSCRAEVRHVDWFMVALWNRETIYIFIL